VELQKHLCVLTKFPLTRNYSFIQCALANTTILWQHGMLVNALFQLNFKSP